MKCRAGADSHGGDVVVVCVKESLFDDTLTRLEAPSVLTLFSDSSTEDELPRLLCYSLCESV